MQALVVSTARHVRVALACWRGGVSCKASLCLPRALSFLLAFDSGVQHELGWNQCCGDRPASVPWESLTLWDKGVARPLAAVS